MINDVWGRSEDRNERPSPTKLMKTPGTLPMFILTWKELGIDENAIINKERPILYL
jgi:hypothetical protein